MLKDFFPIFIFILAVPIFLYLTLWISRLVQNRVFNPDKLISYECGERPVGDSWIKFNNRFYIVALIFIIFDVEVVFLFPWGVVFKELGLYAFIEMAVFIGILLVGLAYVWVKGDLEWIKEMDLLLTPEEKIKKSNLVYFDQMKSRKIERQKVQL